MIYIESAIKLEFPKVIKTTFGKIKAKKDDWLVFYSNGDKRICSSFEEAETIKLNYNCEIKTKEDFSSKSLSLIQETSGKLLFSSIFLVFSYFFVKAIYGIIL